MVFITGTLVAELQIVITSSLGNRVVTDQGTKGSMKAHTPSPLLPGHAVVNTKLALGPMDHSLIS